MTPSLATHIIDITCTAANLLPSTPPLPWSRSSLCPSVPQNAQLSRKTNPCSQESTIKCHLQVQVGTWRSTHQVSTKCATIGSYLSRLGVGGDALRSRPQADQLAECGLLQPDVEDQNHSNVLNGCNQDQIPVARIGTIFGAIKEGYHDMIFANCQKLVSFQSNRGY